MRKLLFVSALSCTMLLFACNLLKKKGADDADASMDASAEAEVTATAEVADAEPPPPPPVTAKNAADVARFPGETAISDDDLQLAQVTPVRSAPKNGTLVTTLKAGSDVSKMAEYQDSFLVSFADPKAPDTQLMGWIPKEAFKSAIRIVRDGGVKATDGGVAAVDAGAAKVVDAGAKPAKLTCPAHQVAIILAKDPVCKKKCTKDSDCKSGCLTSNAQAGGVVRTCAND